MHRPQPSLWEGWRRQGSNIRALILREMMMRYGRGNIGFVWVVLEPMILTAGVMVIWSVMNTSKHGISIIELVLTGYMPLTLWRHLTNGGIYLFRNSVPLLYHRHISLMDLLIGRFGLEFIGTSAALAVVWWVLNLTEVVAFPARPDLIVVGWISMALLAAAVGTLIAAATEASETAERFIQPLQYLNIPISGVFFLVDWLPTWAQKLIVYHPLVHCYETFRAGYFGDSVTTHYNLPYLCACTFILIFFAVTWTSSMRKRLQLN